MKSPNRTKSFSDVAHIHSGKSVFAARGWKRALLQFRHAHWRQILVVFASLVLIGGALFWFTVGRSQTIAFYPASCLGGWEHPENAQGKPDITREGAVLDQFTEQNSAVLRNAASQIYCGSFQGDIPQGSEPVQATIRFSVALKHDVPTVYAASSTPVFNPEFPLLVPPATTTASSSNFVLPALTPDASVAQPLEQSIAPEISSSPVTTDSISVPESPLPIASDSAAPSPSAVPAAEPSPAGTNPVPVPSPSPVLSVQPSPVDTPSPVVWLLHFLFHEAFALDAASSTPDVQASPIPSVSPDTAPSSSASPVVTLPMTPSMSPVAPSPVFGNASSSMDAATILPAPSPEPIVSPADIPASEPTPDVLAAPAFAATPDIVSLSPELTVSANPSPEVASSTGALWEVLYTTDGATWNHVAYLGQGDWNMVQAALPSFFWKDLATLQISIQSLATGETVPAVYLDSLWLEVGYAPGNLFEYIPLQRVSPDFSFMFIDTLKASDGYVLAKVATGSSTQLFGFDMTASTSNAFVIASGDEIASDTPIGLKDKTGFWIDSGRHLRGFSFTNMEYLRNKPLIETPDDGFSVPVGYDQLRVVYHADEFGFDSPQTGEIFSDDDSGERQAFYDRYLRAVDPGRDDIVQQNFLYYGAAE